MNPSPFICLKRLSPAAFIYALSIADQGKIVIAGFGILFALYLQAGDFGGKLDTYVFARV